MANNTTLNAGSGGDTLATDDNGAGVKAQIVKLSVSAAGSSAAIVDGNSGSKSANTIRVVLATDQPQLTNKLLVTPDSVALPANQSVNVSQISGTTASVNSGTKDAGTLRVVIATDQVQLTNALLVSPTGSGVITLQASQVSGVANATTTRTTTTGLDLYSDLDILINITNAGAATGVLQLFLQDSADGGTTWDDLVSSNTFTFGASLTTQRFKVSGRIATSATQGGAAQQETLAAGNVRYGPFGDRIRVREKVSGVSGTPTGATYVITCVAKR